MPIIGPIRLSGRRRAAPNRAAFFSQKLIWIDNAGLAVVFTDFRRCHGNNDNGQPGLRSLAIFSSILEANIFLIPHTHSGKQPFIHFWLLSLSLSLLVMALFLFQTDVGSSLLVAITSCLYGYEHARGRPAERPLLPTSKAAGSSHVLGEGSFHRHTIAVAGMRPQMTPSPDAPTPYGSSIGALLPCVFLMSGFFSLLQV